MQNLYFQWRSESFKATKYSCRSSCFSHMDWNINSKALLVALFSSAWFLFWETKEKKSISVTLWSSLFPVCPYSNTEITPDCMWLWPASSSRALPLLAAFHTQAEKSMYFSHVFQVLDILPCLSPSLLDHTAAALLVTPDWNYCNVHIFYTPNMAVK